MNAAAANQDDPRVLVLDRLMRAPRAAIWRCWTEPGLLKQWFAPAPFSVPVAELDVRPGGINRIVMRSPDGQDYPNAGVYLAVEPERRLVVTDAFRDAWTPSDKAFMALELALADEADGTRYRARAQHWSEADRIEHEKMGFHEGWGRCADQLETLARRLAGLDA